jgi:hypothetical protein
VCTNSGHCHRPPSNRSLRPYLPHVLSFPSQASFPNTRRECSTYLTHRVAFPHWRGIESDRCYCVAEPVMCTTRGGVPPGREPAFPTTAGGKRPTPRLCQSPTGRAGWRRTTTRSSRRRRCCSHEASRAGSGAGARGRGAGGRAAAAGHVGRRTNVRPTALSAPSQDD